MSRSGAFKTSLEYYKSFYYVAKFRSISLAAKQLDLTQPSMSSSIKKMENDLECKLFERTRNGVELTPAGQLLWEKVEPACELILEAESALEARKNGMNVLNIVAYEQGYLIYVMPALRLFLQDYPDVKVNLMSRPQDKMTEVVRMGLADLTIVFGPVTEEADLKYTYIGTMQEKFCAGAKFKELQGRKVSIKELSSYPMITYSGGTARRNLQKWFEKYDFVYEPQMEVTGISLMRQSIMDNYGIGDVFPPMVEQFEKEGRLFFLDLDEELPARVVYAVTRNEQNDITRIFLENYMAHVIDKSIPK